MRTVFVLVALVLGAGAAEAQNTGGGASWLEQKVEPSPIVASFGAGFGRMDDHSIRAGEDLIGIVLSLDGGARIMPSLAIVGHFELSISDNDEDEFYHSVLTAGVRYFPAKSVWLQAGLGAGRYYVQYPSGFEVVDVIGVAGNVGAGVVLARAGNFAFGLQGRGAYAAYDEGGITTFSLAIDMSWY